MTAATTLALLVNCCHVPAGPFKEAGHQRSTMAAQTTQQINAVLHQLESDGLLDDQFTQLQQLQDESNPDFVKEVVELYFEDSASKLQNLAARLRVSCAAVLLNAACHSCLMGAQRLEGHWAVYDVLWVPTPKSGAALCMAIMEADAGSALFAPRKREHCRQQMWRRTALYSAAHACSATGSTVKAQRCWQSCVPFLQDPAPDFNQIDQLVHQFKGSSASFGARAIAQLCMGLRNAAHQQDAATCRGLLHQLDSVFITLKGRLEQFLQLEALRKQQEV